MAHVGIPAWPRLASGKIQIDGDAFRMMYAAHPALEGLHALRDALGVIVRARIPIGRDGRNRPNLFPFGTATGRNAQAKSFYNAHASMRSFMVFPQDTIAVYLDWRTQEVGVAAARSGDEQLAEDYDAGDIYHALALMCGLTNYTNIKRWKSEQKSQRQRMKALQLGLNYGMDVRSLAKGLDRHPLIASEVIFRHKQRYPQFWAWRANMVEQTMLTRKIEGFELPVRSLQRPIIPCSIAPNTSNKIIEKGLAFDRQQSGTVANPRRPCGLRSCPAGRLAEVGLRWCGDTPRQTERRISNVEVGKEAIE